MKRPTSPMCRDHDWARQFSQGRQVAGTPRGLLRGPRALKFPLMSLLVRQELGNCRHALAQRAVAGSMVVHFAPENRTTTTRPTTPEV